MFVNPDTGGLVDLAERINRLFDTVPVDQTHGRLHTNDTFVSAMAERGVKTSLTYMSLMRNGLRDNPSAVILGGIASVFDVTVDCFFVEETFARTIKELEDRYL